MSAIRQKILTFFGVKSSGLDKIKSAIVEASGGGLGITNPYSQTWSVYRAVNIISQKIPGLPVLVYRGANEATDRAALELLDAPNSYLTRDALLEGIAQNLLIHGEAFVEIGRLSTGGKPQALYLLPSKSVTVEEKQSIGEPITGYSYNGRRIEKRDMIHITIPDPSKPWRGLSPLKPAMDAAELQYLIDRWNRNTLNNAGVPFIQYEVPGHLDDNAFSMLRTNLDSAFAGATNARKIAIAEGGAKFSPLAMSPVDMDFANQHQRSTRSIALAFGLDPIMLGDNSSQKYSNYQEARKALVQDAVLPHADRIWAALSKALLPPGLEFRVDRDSIPELQDDMESKARALNTAGCLTVEEKREALGYSPEWSGVLLVSAGMQDINDLGVPADNMEL